MTTVIVDGEQPGDAGQSADAAPVEGAEAIAAAAVEISKVEAERDVQIAEIDAASRKASDETFMSAMENEELQQCRMTITTLQAENAALTAQVEALTLTLSPPPSPPSSPPPESEGAPPEAALPEAEAPPEPVKKKKNLIWI